MSKMKIITNNQPREIIYWHELTEKEREEFDYLTEDHTGGFFRYKGWTYDLGEFFRVEETYPGAEPHPFKDWHGYQSDSFFSGTLVRFDDDDTGAVTVARYSC